MSAADRLEKLTVEQLEILRTRAREAAVTTVAEDHSDELEVLEVQTRGQAYALPLRAVEGITDLVSIAAVPRPSALVRGLVSFRGEVLVGVELATLFGQAQVGVADLRRVVVLSGRRSRMALLTEPSLTVGQARSRAFQASSTQSLPFVVGTNERFVTLLDPVALVAHVMAALEGESS